ncbi:MAG: tetratricopeptide repeat protein [Bacteroidota bacterium]
MRNLIPHFIAEQYQQSNFVGRFKAYTMFIDLSGFTPLTETLMRQGNEGAEQLSRSLNGIFEPMVRLVYSQKGFIPYFAGDAFTAIFPTEDTEVTPASLIDTAEQLRYLFTKEGLKKTRFGDFQIGIKIGLSIGLVEWGIVGDQHKTFYFRGPGIDNCAQSEHQAKGQEIIIDQHLYQHLEKGAYPLEEMPQQFYKLVHTPSASWKKPKHQKRKNLPIKTLNQFLPKLVVKFNEIGEFRRVISIFISFRGIESHQALDQFSSIVLRQLNSFSGYFKEVDFGDKGGVMLGFFGAPVSFENNVERALEFVTAIQEELKPIQDKSDLQFRIGITSGLAYTGIVGGIERCQYAAVGNRVNIAARLMIKAQWGEVWVDEEIQKNQQFKFRHQGDIQYKGIESNIPTYQLIGRNVDERAGYSGQMIGREKDLEQLLNFIEPTLVQQYSGMAYIFGEAGIGKSRLSYELKKQLKTNTELYWIVCQADQILQKPFNPFVYALKNFFEQSPENSVIDNEDHFEKHYSQLVADSLKIEHRKGEVVRKELIRTKSILAAQIGITYPNSLWEQLDAKGRYLNTLDALSNFFICISLIHPLVIELEDGHWYDTSSIEFLNNFVRELREYPIFVLVTSRYTDDGSKPYLLSDEALGKNQVKKMELDLNILHPKALQQFAEIQLNGRINPTFSELLARTTNGNPFYLEQIIEYFSESNLLRNINGEWDIKDTNIRVSSSINSILMARIDRLSKLVKETVKAAAVIGREFEIPVLSEVMKVNEDFIQRNGNVFNVLKEQVHAAEQGQIWRSMNELRYIFKHSLLREAVYDMQLTTRLRELHQLIATAIEKLYPESIEERYVDLAFHYGQAEVEDKTNEYLEKAADFAKQSFQNNQALDFYDKLLHNLEKNGTLIEQVKVLLKKGSVMELIGEWDACEAVYERALGLAREIKDEKFQGRASLNLGRLLMLRGNYRFAKRHMELALTYFQRLDDEEGIYQTFGNLGNLFFRQGHYEEATAYFTRSMQLSKNLAYNFTNAQIAANLGLTFMNLGKYEQGIQHQRAELEMCEEQGDKRGMASLYTNLGIVYYEKGDYDNALDCYEKGLMLSEELGNKLLTSIAIGCIGSVYQKKGNFETAMENYIRDLELCEQLGDKQGTAIAFGLIGELRSEEGEFDVALQYLEKTLELCEELGYQKGIAKAVNNLGDIAAHRKNYEDAIDYYQRAIDISRKINNKLVLGYSLVEQGAVYNMRGDYKQAYALHLEVLDIAQQLGNPDLLFEAQIFKANVLFNAQEVEKAKMILQQLLEETQEESNLADIHYEWQKMMPDEINHRQKAFELYQKLYTTIPKFSFKTRMMDLDAKNPNKETGNDRTVH